MTNPLFRRIALILATVVAGALGALTVTSPALADPTCPFHRICWFDLNNWQGVKYVVNPSNFPANTCFNMSTDPNTGINWDRISDSVWWNDISLPSTYVEFYEGQNCTIRSVTRAGAWTPTDYQMQSCTEGAPEWNGPCGPPSNVSHRIRSWAYAP
jgi:hypothetical protein